MEEKKVIIVGQGNVGKTVASQLESKGIKNTVIGLMEKDNTITVNGIAYEPTPRATSKGFSKIASMAMALGSMGGMGFGSGYTRSLPDNVDIIQEFARIQQKKSSLSRWERDEVVRIFNRNFRKVKSNETPTDFGTLQK